MLARYLIIVFILIYLTSCRYLAGKISKLPQRSEKFNMKVGEMLVINSISVLDRRCINCLWRKNYPLEVTELYGTKNVENLYEYISQLNQKGIKVKINWPIVNDSLFFYSRQEWTKKVWRKKPTQNLNGNFLIVSHNFMGRTSIVPNVPVEGEILTTYEFLQLQNSEVIGYTSYTLYRASTVKNQLVKYKDVRRIFKRLLRQ